MKDLLPSDPRIAAVVQKDPAQWSPMEIAISKLNPGVVALNKKYQGLRNKALTIENEQVNIDSAYRFMLDAYENAGKKVESSANAQMNANSAQANVQAAGAISGMGGLANNPAAAAQTRLTAQNQAAIQNIQVAGQRDSALANLAQAEAQIPTQVAGISANNIQSRSNAQLAEAQVNAQNAQAEYARKQPKVVYQNSSKNDVDIGKLSDQQKKDVLTELMNMNKKDLEVYLKENPWAAKLFTESINKQIESEKK